MRKIRVGILFGGRSGEHEVSLASATSVLHALDPEKYEAVPIGITREGRWQISASPTPELASTITLEIPEAPASASSSSRHDLILSGRGSHLEAPGANVDVIFPVLHGPYGEDGTIQGFLETVDLPYVGSGVAASAIGMDKIHMKNALAQAGLPQVPHVLVVKPSWGRDAEATLDRLEEMLSYPMFVKPCNLGSSVGISKARDRGELRAALDGAVCYDRRVIVEQGIDAREVECAVLGNDDPLVSVPGEVISQHEFYDYESKYTDGLADLLIPAPLTTEQADEVREFARRAFLAIDAAGLARVDFFVRRSDGGIVVNEINTIPGFTRTSMYPKLWEASGLSYSELIDRLIMLAFERHRENLERIVTR